MQPTCDFPDPFSDVQRVSDARSRLDRSISGHNRHSLMSESYRRSLRDEGMPPQEVLVAVKRRLAVAVTDMTPDAPTFEASQLATDVGAWAISAYYDAA